MKRFTETNKWNDVWFRKLPCRLKCLWGWITDNCDAAGVLEPDPELATFYVGEVIAMADFNAFMREGKLMKLPGTKYLMVPNFIGFQYVNLSRDAGPHRPCFRALEAHGIPDGAVKDMQGYLESLAAFSEPLSEIANGKVPDSSGEGFVKPMAKDEEKKKRREDTDKEKKGGLGRLVSYSPEFEQFWTVYPRKVGKGAAFASWQHANPPPPLDMVLAAVASACVSAQWRKEDGAFIPLPQTWLNQRRWEDGGATAPVDVAAEWAALQKASEAGQSAGAPAESPEPPAESPGHYPDMVFATS